MGPNLQHFLCAEGGSIPRPEAHNLKESGQTRTKDTRTRCRYNDANPMWSEAQAEQAEQSSGSEAASGAAGARLN